MGKKISLGHVDVDAGMVWIGDPCYTIGEKTYDEFTSAVEDTGYFTGNNTHCEPFGPGVGFAVESGYGDGSYPVTVELDDHGRVKSLTVDFQPEEDDDEDEG